ncbi:MAG: hypothetical protein EOP45_00155 [Sphingobacteriaceae bacterium]|nr:MAG: hypothetical protein EOP45_00155 [Sphingobacteriaceae bacterium]
MQFCLKNQEKVLPQKGFSFLPLLTFCATKKKSKDKYKFTSKYLNNELNNSSRIGKASRKKGLHSFNKMVNVRFEKVPQVIEKVDVYALKRAILSVKPCIDIRHVRRGRKVFSIPRIIPSYKRSLFGGRQLLSALYHKTVNHVDKFAKKHDYASVKEEKSRDKNNLGANVYTHTNVVSSLQSFSENKLHDASDVSFLELSSVDSQLLSGSKFSTTSKKVETSSFAYPKKQLTYTRTTLYKKDQHKGSGFELFSSLGREIRASSRSRSRAIDNKKRIYRIASANRGSIRMSWWS